jgi:hypothetical protein
MSPLPGLRIVVGRFTHSLRCGLLIDRSLRELVELSIREVLSHLRALYFHRSRRRRRHTSSPQRKLWVPRSD